MEQQYRMAYREVIEILKHIPQEEFNKIPKSIIDFFENNKDQNYFFTYDVSKTLVEQKVLRETNSIIVALYKDYFANENQKEKIDIILNNNEKKHENELMEKYKGKDIFKKQKISTIDNEKKTQNIIKYEESFFKKIIKRIKNFFEKF